MKTQTKTRTIPKTPFFAAFSVGAVLFSAHAGGGFATGNQANTYYVGLGRHRVGHRGHAAAHAHDA